MPLTLFIGWAGVVLRYAPVLVRVDNPSDGNAAVWRYIGLLVCCALFYAYHCASMLYVMTRRTGLIALSLTTVNHCIMLGLIGALVFPVHFMPEGDPASNDVYITWAFLLANIAVVPYSMAPQRVTTDE